MPSVGGPGKHLIATLAAAATLAAPLAGCGGGSDGEVHEGARGAPAASEFPTPGGRTLDELVADLERSDLVASPAGQVFTPGSNRLGFGVFTVDRQEVNDAEVAIYAAHDADGRAKGPFPARIESLETEPAFTAKTTADDPDSARVVYASEVVVNRPGEWRLVAVVRRDGDLATARLPSITVVRDDAVPAPGERVPRVHTPTVEEVGDIAEIDTRIPHSTLHDDDLAEVLGEQPVVLVFATPALCQSRVCGPVVDVAEQVKRDYDDEAAFIYMEVYEGNDPNQGLREQVRAFNLPTEPWLFVIDEDGRIDTRIEGAFSVAELEQAVERVID
jgi:hypothetical protein